MIDTKYKEALEYHELGMPGKLAIIATKKLQTQKDLSLAYSPGVAGPCLKISKNIDDIYKYTSRANVVAVISNGSAVLGLGNLGAAASKPVMEGKAVLFKKFADIDAFDLEIDTQDPETFINVVKYLGYSFGAINLEDIKAPECFMIEERLKQIMSIPVFHDDQHGTAIVILAGIINSLHITKKSIENAKIVVNGAGAASIACIDLLVYFGFNKKNIILCDTNGVIYQGRTQGMNKWKEQYATNSDLRKLEDAIKSADIFLGLSAAGALSKTMVSTMAKQPIIFAMANPDPEITPGDVKSVREDAIIATGRSDYNNQINNVLGFPYIFRGALDVRASTINKEMQLAASISLAEIARQPIDEEIYKYGYGDLSFGQEYIIPVPFDPRLIASVSVAVAKAAINTKVAQITNIDFSEHARMLNRRLKISRTME